MVDDFAIKKKHKFADIYLLALEINKLLTTDELQPLGFSYIGYWAA